MDYMNAGAAEWVGTIEVTYEKPKVIMDKIEG
jgi:hypothetical protein